MFMSVHYQCPCSCRGVQVHVLKLPIKISISKSHMNMHMRMNGHRYADGYRLLSMSMSDLRLFPYSCLCVSMSMFRSELFHGYFNDQLSKLICCVLPDYLEGYIAIFVANISTFNTYFSLEKSRNKLF